MHIHKTGGTSFKKILERQYGNQLHVLNRGQVNRGEKEWDELVRINKKIVHGHIPYNDIKHIYNPNTKIITWLREPVDRVISNYYYTITQEYPKRRLENSKRHLSDELDDYIYEKKRINVISKFLEGLDLRDLFFVGFLEEFDSDLRALEKIMGWTLKEEDFTARHNPNLNEGYEELRQNPVVRKKIAELNQLDIHIFEEARKLKAQNHWG